MASSFPLTEFLFFGITSIWLLGIVSTTTTVPSTVYIGKIVCALTFCRNLIGTDFKFPLYPY